MQIIASQTFKDFKQDAINITEDNSTVSNNVIEDTLSETDVNVSKMAHRDAIQLIPSTILGKKVMRSQFICGSLNNITISNNLITSSGQMQGIFMSDGLLNNIKIEHNIINTNSQHFISLSGVLSGTIYDNFTNVSGVSKLCDVLLTPCRVGGNIGNGNLWIVGFKNLVYGEVSTDSEHIRDLRFDRFNKYDSFLYDFDLESFHNYVSSISLPVDIVSYSNTVQTIAKQFGSIM